MKRQSPFFSPLGCLGAAIMLIGLAAVLLFTGGETFSPGDVSAEARNNAPLNGQASHVTFETQCGQCHVPFGGISADRCLACHATQAAELVSAAGLHGNLINGHDCAACHTDHKGRAFLISAVNPLGFEHQSVGFSLKAHDKNYDGQPFACRDCHTGDRFTFDPQTCTDCHSAYGPPSLAAPPSTADAAFMQEHLAAYGPNCLTCHDGVDTMAKFNHEVAFPLTGGHANLVCEKCHAGEGTDVSRFTSTKAECAACHAEPQIHAGKFGAACADCHTTEAWTPARLANHPFPLDHGETGTVACATCHETDYVTYTCYGCHDHTPENMRAKHLEEGIADYAACAECHPTGREKEGD